MRSKVLHQFRFFHQVVPFFRIVERRVNKLAVAVREREWQIRKVVALLAVHGLRRKITATPELQIVSFERETEARVNLGMDPHILLVHSSHGDLPSNKRA